MPSPSHTLPAPDCSSSALQSSDWIAIAAHRLAHRWPHVLPEQLDELAADLWRDATLRELPPAEAVEWWLRPLTEDPQPLRRQA
ncbi:MAG: hypothetical protein M3Y22_03675 [Pseudomonadota bacterium]|nr:hypothetical protein [Pseudomonadota bacterium]